MSFQTQALSTYVYPGVEQFLELEAGSKDSKFKDRFIHGLASQEISVISGEEGLTILLPAGTTINKVRAFAEKELGNKDNPRTYTRCEDALENPPFSAMSMREDSYRRCQELGDSLYVIGKFEPSELQVRDYSQFDNFELYY